MFSTFSRCASSSSAIAVALLTEPVIMIALLLWMYRVCACTATLGLVSESAMPYFTVLPSTPLPARPHFAAIGLPSLICAMASS
jgi:hypothetical protein